MWLCTMPATFSHHFTRNRYFSTTSTVLTTKYSSLLHKILSCSIVTWPCSVGFSLASDVLSHIPFFLLFLLCQDLCYCSHPPHRLSSYSTLPCSEWFALAWNAFMWLCYSHGSVCVMYIPCTYPDFLFRSFYFNMCFTSFPFYSRYASISCFASFIISYTFISKKLWKIISYIWPNRIRYVLKTDVVYFLLNQVKYLIYQWVLHMTNVVWIETCNCLVGLPICVCVFFTRTDICEVWLLLRVDYGLYRTGRRGNKWCAQILMWTPSTVLKWSKMTKNVGIKMDQHNHNVVGSSKKIFFISPLLYH